LGVDGSPAQEHEAVSRWSITRKQTARTSQWFSLTTLPTYV
jgi:predicted lipid-binding transport protein (Tim44 family)